MNPRITYDNEIDELGRYYHAHCEDCGDYRDFDTQMDAEDYGADHTCEPTSAQLARFYGGEPDDSAYRQQMTDAGRWGLLR